MFSGKEAENKIIELSVKWFKKWAIISESNDFFCLFFLFFF